MMTNVAQFIPKNVVAFAPTCKPMAKYSHLLCTTSNEPLAPVRLYFQVNPRRIVGHLGSMSCVAREDDYYLMFYEDEMLSSEFVLETEGIPEKHCKLIVGRTKVNYKQQTMIIDTNSYLRALAIISFLNLRTTAQAKELTHLATYNRFIFTSAKNPWSRFVDFNNFNKIFTETKIHIIEQNDYYDVPDVVLDQKAKQRLLLDYPIVEKFPASNSASGVNALNWLLKFKYCLAQTISEGKNYSMYNFYREIEQHGFNI